VLGAASMDFDGRLRIQVTVMGPWAYRRSATSLPCRILVVGHFSNFRAFEATRKRLHTVISLISLVLPTLLESRNLAFWVPFCPTVVPCLYSHPGTRVHRFRAVIPSTGSHLSHACSVPHKSPSCNHCDQRMGQVTSKLSRSDTKIPRGLKFRVLIIGRANAGKTSILQRVCNTTEGPKILRLLSQGNREQVRSYSY
jgi:hypothetical protein